MCGRYSSTKDPARLAAEYGAVDQTAFEVAAGSPPGEQDPASAGEPSAGESRAGHASAGLDPPGPDYNVAPTKRIFTVLPAREAAEDVQAKPRRIRVARWGLVPKWAKDRSIGSKMINARIETVAQKPAYRAAVRSRRCLVPADGWYEWQRIDGGKQPYFMTVDSGLTMAGIFERWWDPQQPESRPLLTCSVLTTEATGQLAEIHQRMPLLLTPQQWQQWLDPAVDLDALPATTDDDLVAGLELRPIGPEVGNVRSNGPELLRSLDQGGRAAGSDQLEHQHLTSQE